MALDLRRIANTVGEMIGRPFVTDAQLKILESLGKGQDVFCCLPTGAGKSMAYIAAPFVLHWARSGGYSEEPKDIVIVVSPLIAIMKEQVAFLISKGLKAVYVGDEVEEVDLAGLNRGDYNYVFGSPESMMSKYRKLFTNPSFKSLLGAVFIDESHCILKW